MLIIYGMLPSDDTWLIYWGFLQKDNAILDYGVMIIDDDYGFFTYDIMWKSLCWFIEGYDKALSTKEAKQVDLDEIKRMR